MSKTVQRISAEKLLPVLEQYKKENCVVIDARDSSKFTQGHIPGAVNVDPSIMNSHLKLLNYLNKTAIFIYCGYGIRTQSVIEKLKDARYKGDLYSISDGFEGWQDLGYEVE
jgi:rhodanese-related sulfurtransferase